METQDRYEIRRKIGQGGVGAVYEGYDHQLRRRVAVKRLLETGEVRSEEAVAELLKECHALSALNSPNIVQLFDFGQDSDGPFVVMELLSGETLDALISKAPFTEADFMVLAEQSLEGLLAAHQAHLLHRDLKPCNFIVTRLPSGRMQLKILDFGLAKLSVEPSKQTIAHGNSLFGSIYFMAPEQFEQLPLDARTDLYALGSVFYYALTGHYPFNGESVAQVMASHLRGQYRDLREYRPDLDPLICKWVMSLISRKPENRPENCTLALAQFLGIQNGNFIPLEPIQIAPSSHQLPIANASTKRAPAQTNTISLLPGAEKNTDPVRPHTGQVNLHINAQTAADLPSAIPTPVSLTNRPAEHTGAIHLPPPIAPFPPSPTPVASKKTIGHSPSPSLTPMITTGSKAKSKLPFYANLAALITLTGSVSYFLIFEKSPFPQETNPQLLSPQPLLKRANLIRALSLPSDRDTLLLSRDKNDDGKLSLEEFTTAPTKTLKAKLKNYFPKIDTNDDGSLSPRELDQAYQQSH